MHRRGEMARGPGAAGGKAGQVSAMARLAAGGPGPGGVSARP